MQRETLLRKDVKFHEDVRYSSLQNSPSVIEENEEVFAPNIDPETHHESDSNINEVILGSDVPSPYTIDYRRLICLT